MTPGQDTKMSILLKTSVHPASRLQANDSAGSCCSVSSSGNMDDGVYDKH